ncbi:conserved exported hypothetical protein [Candidatus Methylobacter favarea]|uniref:PEGA domain-containing protein n=1 Tax=Candidatus Methylobacter favarea TaxID=2707345 RepID=A0A8S0WYL5_9GAMM|nr:hypothetical protein [Candidatus Methylobacter favarea]CAA9889623.1 conserved exported hypothetical protein [Candidatus Methylobacter favarea]
MKINKGIIALVVGTTVMSGCASIVSQSNWPVAIKSTPEASAFTITNQKGEKIHTGTTPATVNLPSGAGFFDGETYTLHFTKDGFQEKTATLDTRLNGWYFGNLIFGGIIGILIIDPATGAMFKLPETFSADLTAQFSSIGPSSTEFKIISLNNVPQELRSQLILVK